jgi:hypothetical protein
MTNQGYPKRGQPRAWQSPTATASAVATTILSLVVVAAMPEIAV